MVNLSEDKFTSTCALNVNTKNGVRLNDIRHLGRPKILWSLAADLANWPPVSEIVIDDSYRSLAPATGYLCLFRFQAPNP
jgi:hypothetical protein